MDIHNQLRIWMPTVELWISIMYSFWLSKSWRLKYQQLDFLFNNLLRVTTKKNIKGPCEASAACHAVTMSHSPVLGCHAGLPGNQVVQDAGSRGPCHTHASLWVVTSAPKARDVPWCPSDVAWLPVGHTNLGAKLRPDGHTSPGAQPPTSASPTAIKWMMTSPNGNIFCVTGPLCGEFTGHRWISHTNCQWRVALMLLLICASTNTWANNGDAGDLRR